jgi:hypothetical protein
MNRRRQKKQSAERKARRGEPRVPQDPPLELAAPAKTLPPAPAWGRIPYTDDDLLRWDWMKRSRLEHV